MRTSPEFLAAALGTRDHEVTTAKEAGLLATPDPVILAYAHIRALTAMTQDRRFRSVLNFPVGGHSGIVVLRPSRLLPSAWVARTMAAPLNEVAEDLSDCLAVVDENKTRIRRS